MGRLTPREIMEAERADPEQEDYSLMTPYGATNPDLEAARQELVTPLGDSNAVNMALRQNAPEGYDLPVPYQPDINDEVERRARVYANLPQMGAGEPPQRIGVGEALKRTFINMIPFAGQAINAPWIQDKIAEREAYNQRVKQAEDFNKQARDFAAQQLKDQYTAFVRNENVNRYANYFMMQHNQSSEEAFANAVAYADSKAMPTPDDMEPFQVTLKDGLTIVALKGRRGFFRGDPATGAIVPLAMNDIAKAEKVGTASDQGSGEAKQWQAERAMKWAKYNNEVAHMPDGYVPNDLDYAKAEQYWKQSMATSGGGDEPLDRQQFALEVLKRTGKATPEDLMRLDAIKATRLTVPSFSAGAASDRATEAYRRRQTINFQNSPTVRSFNKAAEGISFALKFDPKTTNASDHIGMIYAFAKVIDPESVVREGEYKTVQKYAQAWMEETGLNLQRIIDNKGILTPDAIKKMQNTMRVKFTSQQEQLSSLRNEIGRMIDAKEGTQGAVNSLPDYTIPYKNIKAVRETKVVGTDIYEKWDDGLWHKQ